jgi:proliferating cell nuclear antigen
MSFSFSLGKYDKMLMRLDNPISLIKAIDVISELVADVRIKVDEFGINITAIDPANVAMVEFRLPKEAFSQFDVKEEVLGINLDSLKRILKRCSSGSSLVLERRENMLVIQIHDRIKRNFTLSLIDIEREEKDFPELTFSSRVKMNSVDMIDSTEDCLVVADSCSFIVSDGKFIIEAKGLNSARAEFSGDEADIDIKEETNPETGEVIRSVNDPRKSKYSLEYLQKFAKGAKLADKVVLKFSEDHPLKMEVKADNMHLNFLLAPRVETGD